MKMLHVATALLESGAGIALLCCPSTAAVLLLNEPVQGLAALTLVRIGGAGLLTLGVAAWFASRNAQSGTAQGFVKAMVIYNLGAVIILGSAGVHQVGILLWPAVLLHVAMTLWCVASVWKRPISS